MGVSPLGAPNRHSLGRLLPYQLADGAQAASLASYDFNLAITLGIAPPFGGICPTKDTFLGITHPFAMPLRAFDLHVLGTPPAFILSQDQTLIRTKYNSLRSTKSGTELIFSVLIRILMIQIWR